MTTELETNENLFGDCIVTALTTLQEISESAIQAPVRITAAAELIKGIETLVYLGQSDAERKEAIEEEKFDKALTESSKLIENFLKSVAEGANKSEVRGTA